MSTTGVADPSSGQDGITLGMVYIGIDNGEFAEGLDPFHFEGGWNEVREVAVLEALAQLRKAILTSRPG